MPSTACHLTVPPRGVRWINQTPSAAREGRGGAYPASLPLLRDYSGDPLRPPLDCRQHLVDHAVFLGLGGREELVTLDVAPDELLVPAGVPGENVLHRAAHPEDLVGLDLHVRRLAVA